MLVVAVVPFPVQFCFVSIIVFELIAYTCIYAHAHTLTSMLFTYHSPVTRWRGHCTSHRVSAEHMPASIYLIDTYMAVETNALPAEAGRGGRWAQKKKKNTLHGELDAFVCVRSTCRFPIVCALI